MARIEHWWLKGTTNGTGDQYVPVSAANPLPVTGGTSGATAPYVGTPLGYQQITNLASATNLTVPAGATFCQIIIEGNIVRWRDDGVAPTATVGMPITPYGGLNYSGDLAAIQFIQAASGASLNVVYYK